MEEAEQITSVQRFPHAATVLDINRFADEKEADLALCLKPFFGNYNRPQQLVEFLEYYRLMGEKKVLTTNYSNCNFSLRYLCVCLRCFPLHVVQHQHRE